MLIGFVSGRILCLILLQYRFMLEALMHSSSLMAASCFLPFSIARQLPVAPPSAIATNGSRQIDVDSGLAVLTSIVCISL